jgi:exopolysaccharide production protein ExoY
MAMDTERLPESDLVRVDDVELLQVLDVDASAEESLKQASGEGARLTGSVPWRACKRAVDLALGVVAILLALPIMAVIVLVIKIDSPGPVFFVHRRVARGGSGFGLVKFRTMVCDAEVKLEAYLRANADSEAEWSARQKLRHDPRITRVGRILRKWSLDELPQLFNILLGHMSLVGPRAIIEQEVVRFGDYASAILAIKPGLTGLWAVSGRNDVSQQERAQLEYQYAINWSMLLDAQILLKTLPAVVRGNGAY